MAEKLFGNRYAGSHEALFRAKALAVRGVNLSGRSQGMDSRYQIWI